MGRKGGRGGREGKEEREGKEGGRELGREGGKEGREGGEGRKGGREGVKEGRESEIIKEIMTYIFLPNKVQLSIPRVSYIETQLRGQSQSYQILPVHCLVQQANNHSNFYFLPDHIDDSPLY